MTARAVMETMSVGDKMYAVQSIVSGSYGVFVHTNLSFDVYPIVLTMGMDILGRGKVITIISDTPNFSPEWLPMTIDHDVLSKHYKVHCFKTEDECMMFKAIEINAFSKTGNHKMIPKKVLAQMNNILESDMYETYIRNNPDEFVDMVGEQSLGHNGWPIKTMYYKRN